MKHLASPRWLSLGAMAAAGLAIWVACSEADSGSPPAPGGGTGAANVLQFHKNASRDGLYVDAAFTKSAAANIHMDTTFTATIMGPTFAQPLYFEGGPGGKNLVIAATEQNMVYALDAATGAEVWQKKVVGDPRDAPVPRAQMPCGGEIDPFGITGTPVIDPASRTIFLDAMTSSDGGMTKKHKIFALSLDDGSTRAGWPVDVSTLTSGSTTFPSQYQSQRAALALLDGTLYVPYGGLNGDCGNYHGWVIAVPIDHPDMPKVYATTAALSGIWGPGGIASDGTSLFVTTGNAPGGAAWGHQEAVLRIGADAVFSGEATDYFAPSNWAALDSGDVDLGGSGPILVDVPGATPSALVVALGKNGVIYLLDRANLGGFGKGNGTTGEGLASAKVSSAAIIQAGAAYTTSQGTYVVLRSPGQGCPAGQSGDLTAVKIGAANPPAPAVAWCARQGGSGSPIVTTTGDGADAMVWSLATGGTTRLLGFDGDTGAQIFNGGGSGDAMTSTSRFVTPMVASGRIFVAANSAVYAFTMK
jgi:hypothetical protein